MRRLHAIRANSLRSRRWYVFVDDDPACAHNDAVMFERRVICSGTWAEYLYQDPPADLVDKSRRVRPEPDESRHSIYERLRRLPA